jgi:cell wall-associated NlpC family hydrolase
MRPGLPGTLLPCGALFLTLCLGGSALAQSQTFSHERFVTAAREVLGVPYDLGGRLRDAQDGIDCQGVLFYAAERVGACGWKSFSVMPTKSIPAGELGKAVEGMAPVASSELDLSKLQPGDVLLLVGFGQNPAEPAIGTLKGQPVWVWHTGLYSGAGKWIVGDHFAGQVVEVDLKSYLAEHSDTYAGLVVTRMTDGPRPMRCRKHAPMQLKEAHRPSGGFQEGL